MLDNKKVVMVIAPVDFRDEELFEPKKILESAGVHVTVASTVMTSCMGMLKGTITPDMLLIDVKASDFDAVVFVGGGGASYYWNDAIAHKIVIDAVMLNKIVGAICIAPIILANAGVLEGRRATVWSSEVAKLTAKGAYYTGERVTYDRNIITANGPTSAEQFGRSLIKGLQTL